jgi:hypothetical protein
MISVIYNETNKAIEMHLDLKGLDRLIETLQNLKSNGDHLHLYATDNDRGLATWSPYDEKLVYTELILNLLPAEAWSDNSPNSKPQ